MTMTKKYIVDNEELVNWYFDTTDGSGNDSLIFMATEILHGYNEANKMGRTVKESRDRKANPPTLYEQLIYSPGDIEVLSKSIFERADYIPVSVLVPDLSDLPEDDDEDYQREFDKDDCILASELKAYEIRNSDDEFLEQVEACQSPEEALGWFDNNSGHEDTSTPGNYAVDPSLPMELPIEDQVYFHKWLNVVQIDITQEQKQDFYSVADLYKITNRDALFSELDKGAGSTKGYLPELDELEALAFEVYKNEKKGIVLYEDETPTQPVDALRAKRTNLLRSIGSGSVVMSPDQLGVEDPENPTEGEVRDILTKLDEKGLLNLIKSSTPNFTDELEKSVFAEYVKVLSDDVKGSSSRSASKDHGTRNQM
jgi:hypothetical protein